MIGMLSSNNTESQVLSIGKHGSCTFLNCVYLTSLASGETGSTSSSVGWSVLLASTPPIKVSTTSVAETSAEGA